jgi:hypothetical protein
MLNSGSCPQTLQPSYSHWTKISFKSKSLTISGNLLLNSETTFKFTFALSLQTLKNPMPYLDRQLSNHPFDALKNTACQYR